MARRPRTPGEEAPERRQKDEVEAIPAGEGFEPGLEARLMGLAGFERAELYERRGPTSRWGLARFLEPGDKVIEVHADHARIQRKDGSQQTFWNLRKPTRWLRPRGPAPA